MDAASGWYAGDLCAALKGRRGAKRKMRLPPLQGGRRTVTACFRRHGRRATLSQGCVGLLRRGEGMQEDWFRGRKVGLHASPSCLCLPILSPPTLCDSHFLLALGQHDMVSLLSWADSNPFMWRLFMANFCLIRHAALSIANGACNACLVASLPRSTSPIAGINHDFWMARCCLVWATLPASISPLEDGRATYAHW